MPRLMLAGLVSCAGRHSEGRRLGILGGARGSVLVLNLALDGLR